MYPMFERGCRPSVSSQTLSTPTFTKPDVIQTATWTKPNVYMLCKTEALSLAVY